MKRRDFVEGLTAAAGYALLGGNSNLWGKTNDEKPNILFLFADDQSHEALSLFGSEVETPNIDRLARQGVSFANAYNQGSWTGAVCVASRKMLNTGRFLWNAKRFNLEAGVKKGQLWSQHLNNSGYDTYMAGKWHVKTSAPQIFGHTGHVRPGMPNQTKEGYHRPKSKEDYENGWKPWEKKYDGFWKGGKHWSEVLGDEGVEFLEKAQKDEDPFFMYLAFNAPHDPRQSPKEYVEKYPLSEVDVPENYLPEYPYNSEIGSGRGLRDEKLAPFPRTEYAVKVNRQEYYAIITHMDAQVGRILDALEKSGKQDNTYILFSADHGLACGHHGLMGKQNMFEHSMKAPLIVTGPGIPQDKKIDTPVYIQDIMPTTLELAGIEIPDSVQFKSLLPLIRGERDKQYDSIYGAYLGKQRMVRKGDFKLIYYPSIDKKLLFNLAKDPNEMNNLADNAKYKGKVKELMRTLRTLQPKMGDSRKI